MPRGCHTFATFDFRRIQCSSPPEGVSAMRFGAPTSASSAAHFVLSFSFLVSSSPAVISSNSASSLGSPAAFRLSLEMRLSVEDAVEE